MHSMASLHLTKDKSRIIASFYVELMWFMEWTPFIRSLFANPCYAIELLNDKNCLKIKLYLQQIKVCVGHVNIDHMALHCTVCVRLECIYAPTQIAIHKISF